MADTTPKIDVQALDFSPSSPLRGVDKGSLKDELSTIRRGIHAIVDTLGGVEALASGRINVAGTEPAPPDTTGPTAIDAPDTVTAVLWYIDQASGGKDPHSVISWDASTTPGVTQYSIQQNRVDEGIWRAVNTIDASMPALVQAVGPLIETEDYQWRVRAETTAVQSAWTTSNTLTATPYSATPGVPSGLTVTFDGIYMVLAWTYTSTTSQRRFNIYDSDVKFDEAPPTVRTYRILMTKRSYSIKIDSEDNFGNFSAKTAAVVANNTAPTFTGTTVTKDILETTVVMKVASADLSSASRFMLHVGTSSGFTASAATQRRLLAFTNDVTDTDVEISADVTMLMGSNLKVRLWYKLQIKDALSDALGDAAVYSTEFNDVFTRSEVQLPVATTAPTVELADGDKWVHSTTGVVQRYDAGGAAWKNVTPAIEVSTGYLDADITGTRTLRGTGVLYVPTAGDLSVGTAASPSTRSKTMRIPHGACVPMDSDESFETTFTSPSYVFPQTAAVAANFKALAHFAAGTALTAIRMYAYRGTSSDVMTVLLYRVTSTGTLTQVGSTLTHNTTGYATISTSLSETVAATYHYLLSINLTGAAAAADARFVHVEIDYTMAKYEQTL